MSKCMDETVKRWKAKRRTALAIAIITDRGRRQSAADKLRIVEQTMFVGESIASVAGRNGVAPNLLYRWSKLILEGGSKAVAAGDSFICGF